MVKILISGIFGHMGRNVAELVAADKDCELMCGVDLKAGELNGAPVYASFADVKEKADAVIDFSSAANLANVLSYAETFGVPAVLAATGYTEADLKAIDEASKKVAIFKTANLSVGINLLQKLVKEAAAFLGEAFDIEIVEKHHNQKKDAPSGTALALAESMNEALGNQYHYVYDRSSVHEKRDPKEIGIASVRGGSIVGDHDVIFAGTDEVITFSHTAYSRAIFGKGAIQAAKYLAGKPAGFYHMSDVINAQV